MKETTEGLLIPDNESGNLNRQENLAYLIYESK